jgi:hypothetical protein
MPKPDYAAWAGTWSHVAGVVSPAGPATVRLSAAETHGLDASCLSNPEPMDCPCWRPRQAESRVAPSLTPQVAQQIAFLPRLLQLVDPKPRVQPPTAITPPPLRPPIEQVGWSFALFPLPPPFKA